MNTTGIQGGARPKEGRGPGGPDGTQCGGRPGDGETPPDPRYGVRDSGCVCPWFGGRSLLAEDMSSPAVGGANAFWFWTPGPAWWTLSSRSARSTSQSSNSSWTSEAFWGSSPAGRLSWAATSGQACCAEDEEGSGTQEICLKPGRTVSVAAVCVGPRVSLLRALRVRWGEVLSWPPGVGALSAEDGTGADAQAGTAGAAHSASNRSCAHAHEHTHVKTGF